MFADCSYRCAGIDNSAEATFVCYEKSCTAYPFMCGRSKCACMNLHRKHQAQPLGGLIEELGVPPILPEELTNSHKEVDGLIGALIAKLESLRKQHKDYAQQYSVGSLKSVGLRQGLLRGEPLEPKQATGDAISKMLLEISNISKVKSPYSTGEELETQLQNIRDFAQQLFQSIEQLWGKKETEEPSKPAFVQQGIPLLMKEQPQKEVPVTQTMKFANNMRHPSLDLSEGNTSITTDGDLTGKLKLALVQPALSLKQPFSMEIEFSRFDGCVIIGLCIQTIVLKNDYQLATLSLNHGTYTMMWNGSMLAHGKKKEERKGLKYNNLDRVKVSWNPLTSEITYFLGKQNKKATQQVSKEHLLIAPLYFCVAMRGMCIVNMVA